MKLCQCCGSLLGGAWCREYNRAIREMASGGSDDNLWARTPMGEVLAKASLSQTTPAHAVHLET